MNGSQWKYYGRYPSFRRIVTHLMARGHRANLAAWALDLRPGGGSPLGMGGGTAAEIQRADVAAGRTGIPAFMR